MTKPNIKGTFSSWVTFHFTQPTKDNMKQKKQTLMVSLSCLILGNLTPVANAQILNKNCNLSSSDSFQTGFQIQARNTQTEANIISAKTPSQTEITQPSLWWAVEKNDPFEGKLVTNWIADQNEKIIDIIVNNRLWNGLDYLGKYRLVNQLGTVARESNYNLQVISQQQDCLATYTCELTANPPNCKIKFDGTFN